MKSFCTKNRKKLMERMNVGEVAVLFSGEAPQSTADSMYDFRPDKNFYYLTGLTREKFILILTKLENKVEEILFIEKPDYDIEKWVGKKLTIDQTKEISGINNVKYITEFESFFNRMIYTTKYEILYLDLARMGYNKETTVGMKFADEVSKNYKFINIKNIHKFMCELRVIKSDFEIANMRKAIEMTKDGLEAIMKSIKPNQYEYISSVEFNYSIMKDGADGNSFPTIAASGENAVILHYVENNQIIADGNLILFDLGAQYNQYAADISRTYPANGKYSERQKTIYNIVLKARDEVVKIMKPGVEFSSLNKKSIEILTEELIRIGLIKEASELSKYYYHGVSHFLGLDVHDIGDRDVKLEQGMVLTVEPGLYIAEEKIGIRIEDDIFITEDGNENLSEDIIRTIEDIEKFMK